nr:mitochondrial thiamine pyrophosphate carrier-like [Danaus plexippus plexippus]
MVYLIQNESKLSISQSAVAGGLASAVTRAIAQPLDVLKIRFQLQLEPIQEGSKYSSITQAVKSIVKDEGVLTLWSGHVPAQFLSISYGIAQFSTFEKLTQIYRNIDSEFYRNYKHSINFSNGAIAASIATLISFPFDTVRTRLIAEQKTNKVYKGFINAFTNIVKTEGSAALFKESILNGLEFFQRRKNIGSVIESTLIANLLAGGIAGLISKTAIYPFDVVKKRLQIQGFQQHREFFGRQMYCNGTLHCIKLTITNEGFLALYKGYGPSILKAIFVSALHFAVYDEIKYFILRIQS